MRSRLLPLTEFSYKLPLAHAPHISAIRFERQGPPIGPDRFFSSANPGAGGGTHVADLDTDLDAPAAAIVRLRKPPGADARDRRSVPQPAVGHVLPTELAGDPQSGDGCRRAAARPAGERLPGRANLSGRDVRIDHVGRRHAQSGADRPIFRPALAGD